MTRGPPSSPLFPSTTLFRSAAGCDGFVIESKGFEAQRGGILQPQTCVFKKPGMGFVVLRQHEVPPAIGFSNRCIPGRIRYGNRLPTVRAITATVQAHRADQIGGVPRIRLQGLRDILPSLNYYRRRLLAVGRRNFLKQRPQPISFWPTEQGPQWMNMPNFALRNHCMRASRCSLVS